ncbi:hypothetical protein INR49_026674 [Caranx melampygus]|nr:hypothetical protein INR49_026674 [Caranx melampygus]
MFKIFNDVSRNELSVKSEPELPGAPCSSADDGPSFPQIRRIFGSLEGKTKQQHSADQWKEGAYHYSAKGGRKVHPTIMEF